MEQLSPVLLLKAALVIYVIAGGGSLLLSRNQKLASLAGFGGALVASIFGFVGALYFLLATSTGPPETFSLLPSFVPYIQFTLKLDPLAAFFLLVLSLLAAAISMYSLGYVGGGIYTGRRTGVLGAFYNALLLAAALVFTSANAFFFLISWEIMALCGFCLISFDHEKQEARSGAVLYFVMSHIGTGCLILGFLVLFQGIGGIAPLDYSFDRFRSLRGVLSLGQRDAAFLLFLAGFGVKAGIVPLHIWLPAAHPVAPSNISALLSGIIIKTGIYGMIRVFFDFLGTPPNWWGVTVLTIGTVSALLGVLYALMEHDLKRLLAYHSIENIGIILMGLGAAMMFLHTDHLVLASLALIAALYHTLNHAIFKGLLFLGAGAVLHSARTRNMEEMGGLIKKMPTTAICFLVGSVAISALPPLNGFVSEWLTYQALLQGFGTTSSLVRIMFPLSGAMLALTGALAAACFVKAFGISFLAQPRSDSARDAHEVSKSMLTGMILLSAACVFLGLFPTVFLKVLDPITTQLSGQHLSDLPSLTDGLVLGSAHSLGGTVCTAGLVLTGVCLLPIPLVFWLWFGRGTKTRIGPTWDCGLRGLTPAMEYTATGFSKPIRMIFKALFRPRREMHREYDYSPYFAKTLRFESHIEEAFASRVYRPLNRGIIRLSRRMRALQAGSIQAYLIYIFVTLVLLLLLAL
jgi:hydrogenase-4 component B